MSEFREDRPDHRDVARQQDQGDGRAEALLHLLDDAEDPADPLRRPSVAGGGEHVVPAEPGEPVGADESRGPSGAERYQLERLPQDPLELVPEGASQRSLQPDPSGGAQEGVEYKWRNEEGQTVRLRIHGPDGKAPKGSNAADGPVYRLQVGQRYVDADGRLHPTGIHNPRSPNYDPQAANATHIPWPCDLPLPW